jgi:hypothetical protein
MEVTAAERRFSWRAVLRYRLRSLLILATVIAVALAAWVQVVEKPYERQRAALAALDKFTQRVEFQDRGPRWLPEWVAKRFRRAVALHVERLAVRDEHLRHIGQLPHLERLYLARTGVTDEGLSHLAGLSKLRRLSLWGTTVSDAGLQHFSAMRQLEALDIHESKCTQACLAHLAPGRRMKTLRFNFELDNRGVADLARLSGRAESWLRCRNLTLDGLRKLRGLQGIKSLSLRGSAIGVAEAETLSEIAGLTSLVAYEGHIDGPALLVLRSAPWLQELRLINMGIDGAEVLRQCATSVDHLFCSRNSVLLFVNQPPLAITISSENWTLAELSQATGLRHLRVEADGDGKGLDFSRLKNLRELIWLAPMPESQVSQLGGLTNLRKLVLRVAAGVSPSAFGPLGRLQKLESLSLVACHLTDEHLTFLEGLTALRELSLGENPLQGGCLAHLRQLSQLQHLSLQECPNLDEANLKHLAVIESLANLNLQYTPVGDAGIKALYGLPSLTIVSLLGSRVTQGGRAELKASLPRGINTF